MVWAALLEECWSSSVLVTIHLATERLDSGLDLHTSPWTTAVLWTCLATRGTDPVGEAGSVPPQSELCHDSGLVL